MRIQFAGAAQTVTGSKHLITTKAGKRILLDCGLFQNRGSEIDKLNRHFPFNPADIDAVILSHAHIDHSGNLPGLIKQGFIGRIYATPATYDLCEIMLADSAKIHEHDIEYVNKKRRLQGLEPQKPLYTTHDVEKCMRHFKPIPYNNRYAIDDNISFMFIDAGHILGSAGVYLLIKENEKETSLFFTGDIGRNNDLLLKPKTPFPQADYIICESTYGNRLHEAKANAEEKLLNIVMETCVFKKGKLLIPAFSLGRTQEIVYTLNNLQNAGKLPPVKVYVDSPLASRSTRIVQNHLDALNDTLKATLINDPEPFQFRNLTYTETVEESIALNNNPEPCIIIAGSGMMEGGRIKHHTKHAVSDERNTLLIVGYCPKGTLGGRLLNGAKQVKIFDREYEVKMRVEVINSYSAHADYQEMIDYLSCQDKQKIKKIFLVHGESESIVPFKHHLHYAGFNHIEIPEPLQEIELE